MELTDCRVLVVGGAGFIGSHLVDALADLDVVVVDDFSTGSADNLRHHEGATRIEIVEQDYSQTGPMDELLDGVHVVFHLACRNLRHSLGNPRANHDINATATLELLQLARRHDVKRFVYVSTSEVYGTAQTVPMTEDHPCTPETVYGASKLAGEAYTRAYFRTYGLPTIVVRPFNNFGPRSHFEGDSGEVIPRFALWALNGKAPVIFGDGHQTRDFIYVEETAKWLRAIAECDELVGETVNLGSGKETSVLDLASMIYEAAGRPKLTPVFEAERPGDVRRLCAATDKIRQFLDFKTDVDVAEGIQRLLGSWSGLNTTQLLEQIETTNWEEADS